MPKIEKDLLVKIKEKYDELYRPKTYVGSKTLQNLADERGQTVYDYVLGSLDSEFNQIESNRATKEDKEVFIMSSYFNLIKKSRTDKNITQKQLDQIDACKQKILSTYNIPNAQFETLDKMITTHSITRVKQSDGIEENGVEKDVTTVRREQKEAEELRKQQEKIERQKKLDETFIKNTGANIAHNVAEKEAEKLSEYKYVIDMQDINNGIDKGKDSSNFENLSITDILESSKREVDQTKTRISNRINKAKEDTKEFIANEINRESDFKYNLDRNVKNISSAGIDQNAAIESSRRDSKDIFSKRLAALIAVKNKADQRGFFPKIFNRKQIKAEDKLIKDMREEFKSDYGFGESEMSALEKADKITKENRNTMMSKDKVFDQNGRQVQYLHGFKQTVERNNYQIETDDPMKIVGELDGWGAQKSGKTLMTRKFYSDLAKDVADQTNKSLTETRRISNTTVQKNVEGPSSNK